MSDKDFVKDLRLELDALTDPDPSKIVRSPDPQATALVLAILKENQEWLHSVAITDSDGRKVDLIEAIVDPQILGNVRHIHKSGRLFAVVEKIGHFSDVISLNGNLKLQLDSSDNSSQRLRLFVRGIGMLTLDERNLRNLAVDDPRYGEAGRITA